MSELETRQQDANTAITRWQETYCRDGQWSTLTDGTSTKRVWHRLEALGSNPPPDHVDDIIGNNGWTRKICSECRREVEQVVRVGQEPDYESATAWLCRDCVERALALFDPPPNYGPSPIQASAEQLKMMAAAEQYAEQVYSSAAFPLFIAGEKIEPGAPVCHGPDGRVYNLRIDPARPGEDRTAIIYISGEDIQTGDPLEIVQTPDQNLNQENP